MVSHLRKGGDHLLSKSRNITWRREGAWMNDPVKKAVNGRYQVIEPVVAIKDQRSLITAILF